jgi:hypothetical protein
MVVLTRAFWTASILGSMFVLVSCGSHAHTLQPGECISYASDAERFMTLKIQGWSVDEADEGLRKMFEDGRWFTYVRDKEDVSRVRETVHSLWDMDDEVTPRMVREAVLGKCDPDNAEQFRFMFQLPDWHGA